MKMPTKYHIGFAVALTCSLLALFISYWASETSTATYFNRFFGLLGIIINPILWRKAALNWAAK